MKAKKGSAGEHLFVNEMADNGIAAMLLCLDKAPSPHCFLP